MSSGLCQISEILEKMGLTKKESEVYLYLAQSHSPKNGRDVSNRLRIHKGEMYRILKSLQSKGIVESTLDHPMSFSAVQFEEVLDLYIKTMKEQVFRLEAEKKDIVAQCRSTSSEHPVADQERFVILKGRKLIFAKSLQMGFEAKREILWMCTNLDELKYDEKLSSCGVKIRSLINMLPKDVEKIKRLTAIALEGGISAETRCLDSEEEMTYNVLIEDDTSAMLIWKPKMEEDLAAFWTNSYVFVDVWRAFFENLWSGSENLDKRLKQLEKRICEL